jgi:hypothetical protein
MSTILYLPKFLGGGAISRKSETKSLEYIYVDDDEAIAPELSIQEWARRCQLGHADVELEKRALIDAQNLVVQAQARVSKAELFLERQQQGYIDAAKKLPGVPCLK